MRITSITEEPLEEKADSYLKLVTTAVKGLWDPKELGKAELIAYTRSANKNFLRLMGQNSVDYDSVTWNLLFRYLTMPNQLELESSEAMALLKDLTMRQRIMDEIRVANLSFLDPKAKQEYLKTWAVKNKPIGGPPDDEDTPKRAELIITHILSVATVKHLGSKIAGGQDMPDGDQPPGVRTQASQSTASQSGRNDPPGVRTQAQAPQSTASQADLGAQLSQDQLDAVKANLQAIKKGNAP